MAALPNAGGRSSISTAGSSGSGGNEDVADKFGGMMEIMMQNPTVQKVLLSRMPPHMQRPEVLRAMMASPEVRQRIAHMAQQTVSSSTTSGTRGAGVSSTSTIISSSTSSGTRGAQVST